MEPPRRSLNRPSAAPAPAQAHGFAERHDLPLPLGVYLAGAGLAVALSVFVADGEAMRLFPDRRHAPRYTNGGNF